MASFVSRPSNPFRSFFLKVEGSKVRCINCNLIKFERLRNHIKRCQPTSYSAQSDPDLIVESSSQPPPAKHPKTCQSQMTSYSIKTDSAAANQLHNLFNPG